MSIPLKRRCHHVPNLFPSSLQLHLSGAIVKPQGMNRELEKQIVDKILGEGYDKRIRPSGINNKTGQNGWWAAGRFARDSLREPI